MLKDWRRRFSALMVTHLFRYIRKGAEMADVTWYFMKTAELG